MQGPSRNITPGGELNPRGLRRNGENVGSLFALDAPEGWAFHQGVTGTSLQDQRPKRHWAIIQDHDGSGSGAAGSGKVGIGETGYQIAADMHNAYNAKFAQWIVENDTYVCREMPQQPNVLAIEANGATDVVAGTIVELLPGPGMPDVYIFFMDGASSSGSGQSVSITCSDGSHHTATISGDSIVVS